MDGHMCTSTVGWAGTNWGPTRADTLRKLSTLQNANPGRASLVSCSLPDHISFPSAAEVGGWHPETEHFQWWHLACGLPFPPWLPPAWLSFQAPGKQNYPGFSHCFLTACFQPEGGFMRMILDCKACCFYDRIMFYFVSCFQQVSGELAEKLSKINA